MQNRFDQALNRSAAEDPLSVGACSTEAILEETCKRTEKGILVIS